jgi:3-hydroxybutyryl-CoA dehydrogenase
VEQATIGVIGAGQMGGGIAQVCAQRGYSVLMLDINEAAVQRGLGAIGTSLDRLIKKGAVAAEQKKQILCWILSG